jgi:hypothetical protein
MTRRGQGAAAGVGTDASGSVLSCLMEFLNLMVPDLGGIFHTLGWLSSILFYFILNQTTSKWNEAALFHFTPKPNAI